MMNDKQDPDINSFIRDGYLRLVNVFSAEDAAEIRSILWKDIGWDPRIPETWIQPVVRLGDYPGGIFYKVANAPMLLQAFDKLVGKGRWLPRGSLGTFPVRFPVDKSPGDTGWHVDASFPGVDTTDYLSWRINIYSRGRALLMLFLFSDTGEEDAPTRIIPGSHLEVARILEPHDKNGLSFMELAGRLEPAPGTGIVNATGKAGTVYLCHPFLVHAAQPHRGREPRFMAQPPLLPKQEFNPFMNDHTFSPVESAIRMGIGLED